MKRAIFKLAILATFICLETYGQEAKSNEISDGQSQPLKISKTSDLKDEAESVGSNVPTYSELKKEFSKEENLQKKTKLLLFKMSKRIHELKAKIEDLSEKNEILLKENSSLQDVLQKIQNDNTDNDEKNKILNIKLLALEQEKEDLLKKLFEHQTDVQKVKTVSFELNSLLNQMPPEDDITRDCFTFLDSLTDTSNRIDQLIKETEQSNLTYNKGLAIESLYQELNTHQELLKKKLTFYKAHEQKLMNIHKKEIQSVPKQLEELQTTLNTEKQKYPELAKLKLEDNLMNSINIIKAFRLNVSKEKTNQVKLLEKMLHEYIGLKIKESDLKQLENKIQTFSEGIDKLEIMSAEFLAKHNKLEQLKEAALSIVDASDPLNDNAAKTTETQETKPDKK